MSAEAPKDAGSASKKGDVFNGLNRGRKRKFSAVNEEPPQLTCCAPMISEIQTTAKNPNDALLPVDILLLTVKDCGFSACCVQIHSHMNAGSMISAMFILGTWVVQAERRT